MHWWYYILVMRCIKALNRENEMNTLQNIDTWEIEEEALTDSSIVYNVIGHTGHARVTFCCFNEQSALELQQTLIMSGCTVEAQA